MAPAVRCAWADWPVTSGDGVALSNESATQWREEVSCSSASLSVTKRRWHHGSGRGLNALVVVVRVGDGRGILGDSGVIVTTASFVDTQQRRRMPRDLSALPMRSDGRERVGRARRGRGEAVRVGHRHAGAIHSSDGWARGGRASWPQRGLLRMSCLGLRSSWWRWPYLPKVDVRAIVLKVIAHDMAVRQVQEHALAEQAV